MTSEQLSFNKLVSHKGESYRIRAVQDSDIPAIRLLVNAAYKELADMGLNYTATYQDENITRDRINRGRAFALERGDEIVGTVLFTEQNYFTKCRSGYVSQLAIHPSLKKSGLGTILMELCEDIAKSERYEAVQLDTAKPAKHLVDWYQKRGYRVVGETKWEDKTYESWIFEKSLLGPEAIFSQPVLKTARLVLEPIDESHAAELCELFSDTNLHTFVPFVPLTLEQQRDRCAKWAKRKSPDGKELWLNWIARDLATKMPVGHFQAGVKEDRNASVGYVVAGKFQNQGLATEALKSIFDYLQKDLAVHEVKAWSDTRNLASHHVARKMGMTQIEIIKDADFFKGTTSDEFVFSRRLES